jgi:hypothetical protein
MTLALAFFQATGPQSQVPRQSPKNQDVTQAPSAGSASDRTGENGSSKDANRGVDSKPVNADQKDRVERPKPAVKFEEDVFAEQEKGAASKVKGGFSKIGRAIRSAAGAVGDFLVGEY